MSRSLAWSDLEIVRELGAGQAGIVSLARLRKPFRNLQVGAYVAVKSYKAWVLEQPGQYERVFRELEAGRSVHHPNLVETLTLISNPAGGPALVMKYFEGETLERCLSRQRSEDQQVDPESALTVIGKVAAALAALHSAGIIHRDVKPANIVLVGGEPVLMDLGVVQTAKFPEQTTTNAFLGTIRYAAPEYLFGDTYDSSADVFSLGAVAWEMLAGRQYLSEETNWARMIARKSARRSVPFDFAPIQKRFGVNGVEFVQALFTLTLGPSEQRFSSAELAAAFASSLWQRPFYQEDARLVAGEGVCAQVGDWSISPRRVAFSEAWREFLGRVDDADRTLLRTFLDHHYWEHLSLLSYHVRPDPDRLASLSERGLIRTDYHNSTWTCEIHEVIRLGFRYRLL